MKVQFIIDIEMPEHFKGSIGKEPLADRIQEEVRHSVFVRTAVEPSSVYAWWKPENIEMER